MIVEVPRRWRWGIGALVIVAFIELGWVWFGLGGEAAARAAAWEEAREQQSQRRARRRDALAEISASTTDPRVYALGYMTCATSRPASGDACQMLSAAQWARLDPGNAQPWLYALS